FGGDKLDLQSWTHAHRGQRFFRREGTGKAGVFTFGLRVVAPGGDVAEFCSRYPVGKGSRVFVLHPNVLAVEPSAVVGVAPNDRRKRACFALLARRTARPTLGERDK